MAYVGTDEVNRRLWRDPFSKGQKISVGTTDSASMGTADAQEFIDQAQAQVDGMMSMRYTMPPYIGTTSVVHPMAKRWTEMLACASIIRAVVQRTGDGDPDPYAQWLEEAVGSEWRPYAEGRAVLMGTNLAIVKLAGNLYPQPTESHPQTSDVFAVKAPGDTNDDISDEGFVQP